MTNVISIADPNFEQKLIDLGIDSNGLTGTILQYEAEGVTELYISHDWEASESGKINDLSGIEGFVNLRYLNAFNNNLTSVDLSNNLELLDISLGDNKLTEIDISKNLKLNRWKKNFLISNKP